MEHITLEKAGIGGSLTNDYLLGKDTTRPFYSFSPDLDGLKAAVAERKKYPVNRPLLYDVLHKQHGKSFLSEQLKTNIELLLQENTYTVTTGHQLNLFTGPLYFIYKIVSVIALSNKLNDEMPGHHFVPVYWMNSEDHDFEEINHFFLKGEKIEWVVEVEKYGPVGRMSLNGIEPLMDEIKAKFGDRFQNDSVFQFILRAYNESETLADAHREIVNKLFGEYGLVILNQDDADLKTAFIELIAEEIFNKSSIKNVEATNQLLEKEDYKAQVFGRDINIFYTGNGFRERIIEWKDGYSLADNSLYWTTSELKTELKTNPAYFSPNVVMRPLYQEFTLPNIAYVGGPAEIAYWLQYKTNFVAHKIFYPTLVLRDCYLILAEKSVRRMKDLGIKLIDFFTPIDELLNTFIKKNHGHEMDISPLVSGVNEQYHQLLEQVIKVDSSMEAMVKAAHQKTLNDLEKIVQKMNKALKTKNEVQLNTIKNIQATIFPNGILQERNNNFLEHTSNASEFIQQLINHSNPLDARLKLLVD